MVKWRSRFTPGSTQKYQGRMRSVAGIQPSRGTIEEDRWVNAGGSRGARTNKFDQVAENVELYVENQHYVTAKAVAVVGVSWVSIRFAPARARPPITSGTRVP